MVRRITLGNGDPRRLFIGGLHGDEWKDTSAILESLDAPTTGSLAIIPKLTDRAYISTLDDRYYDRGGYGTDVIAAINDINPEIYLELHSYSDFDGLTDPDRIHRVGVPAYIELEAGVLIGSISPILRRTCFSIYDVCLSFEIPTENKKSQRLVRKLLLSTKDCVSRDEFLDFLLGEYPDQGKRAVENYKRFYGIEKI